MKDVKYFETKLGDTSGIWGKTLRKAAAAGVNILAYDCAITEDSMEICDPVPVNLEDTYSANLCDQHKLRESQSVLPDTERTATETGTERNTHA